MTSVEKAIKEVELRTEECNAKRSELRELTNRLYRIRSRESELEVVTHTGDERTKAEFRSLVKERLEVEMLVANAQFSVEDAEGRLALSEQALAEARRAVKSDELKELFVKRLNLADQLNNEIDKLEEKIHEFTAVIQRQMELANDLGIAESDYSRGNGPLVRLANIVESQANLMGYGRELRVDALRPSERGIGDRLQGQDREARKQIWNPLRSNSGSVWSEFAQAIRKIRVPFWNDAKSSGFVTRR